MKRKFDPDTNALEDISVLFIPFDAAKQHYRRNAQRGVTAFKGVLDSSGKPQDTAPSWLLTPQDNYLEGEDIGKELSKIVQQECDNIRNIYNPDDDYAERLELLAKSRRMDGETPDDPSKWSPAWQRRVEKNLKGFKHYPYLVFLSENPTGQDFPDRIDIEAPGQSYIRKYALDRVTVPGIARVNEMALYVRADIEARIQKSSGEDDALYLRADLVTRKTQALYKGGKDEYLLKVTIGKKAGYSLTMAGVHLRATLTALKSDSGDRRQEWDALQRFCAANDLQLLVGDFNLDLQSAPHGGRGVFFDRRKENRPRYLMDETTHVAYPEYVQQFSNSTGDAHYMGYFQADTEALQLVGTGIYGSMGASGSRKLEGGEYYSDHPSIYVRAESQQLLAEADQMIVQRKILRVKRMTQK